MPDILSYCAIDVRKSKDPKVIEAALYCDRPVLNKAAALHPMLPQKVALKFLKDNCATTDSSWTSRVKYLLSNPIIPEHILIYYASKLTKSRWYYVESFLANPNFSAKVAYTLMKSGVPDIMAPVAASIYLGRKAAKLAANCNISTVRLMLATNKRWAGVYADKFSTDRSTKVRLAVIFNDNVSSYTINRMLADKDENVRKAAVSVLRKRLQERPFKD